MKQKNLIIAGIIILAIVGIWLYYQFNTSIFPPSPIERERSALLYGTPEQKEQILTKFINDVQTYNVGENLVQEEQINFSAAKPLIPAIIEAILDDTPLPRQDDTGWGYVYHEAATAMSVFAYKVDGIQRGKDPKYSFYDAVGSADEPTRKQVHDNWLQWWNENKDKI
jgi:hypothetical protein